MTNLNEPIISTIFLNWNRADLLEISLNSYKKTITLPYEIFIIDNASTDNSRDVINQFCADTSNAQAIFRDKNIGGEAINEGLDKCRGRYVHISENDIEYLEGWDQAVVDSFEAFPKLGQLSLFGPVPSDEETHILHPSFLRSSKGRILYEVKRNITTTGILRKEIFEKGIRIHNYRDTKEMLFPDDGLLSKEVKRKGYMVAWSPHYLVNNMGHTISEFEKRMDYYIKNYSDKSNVGIDGFEKRIQEWRQIPKPNRQSFLFAGEKLSPEKTEPSSECSFPRIWSMFDIKTPAIETLEFIYGLVRLSKPELAVETGAWRGYVAVAVGKALKENGVGKMITLEPDVDFFKVAQTHIRKHGLENRAEVLNQKVMSYLPSEEIDFLVLTSEPKEHASEFKHFRSKLKPGALVVFCGDNSSEDRVERTVDKLTRKGEVTGFSLPSPRATAVCRYGSQPREKTGFFSKWF